jgi:hypothetical protein
VLAMHLASKAGIKAAAARVELVNRAAVVCIEPESQAAAAHEWRYPQ